ncbi:MAG TPA: hypothetical protein VIU82_22130 [Bosea sp. (in: a-proteobacteria)]
MTIHSECLPAGAIVSLGDVQVSLASKDVNGLVSGEGSFQVAMLALAHEAGGLAEDLVGVHPIGRDVFDMIAPAVFPRLDADPALKVWTAIASPFSPKGIPCLDWHHGSHQ